MKFLKWYSAIIVSYSIVACFIAGITQASQFPEESAWNLWGAIMYIPIAVYLWSRVKKAE